MREKAIRIFALVMMTSMFAALLPIATPLASAAPVTKLTIAEPKHGTSPVYVTSQTNFTITVSETADIWYSWGLNNYTKYTGTFNPVVILGSSGGAPGLPVELEGLVTLYYNATGEAQRSIQIYVDDYVPHTTISFSGVYYKSDYVYVNTATQMSLAAVDNGSGVWRIRYAINNNPMQDYVAPFTVSGIGLQDIFYYAIDNVNNTEVMEQITLSMDNDPPTIAVLPGTPKYTDTEGTVWVTSDSEIAFSFIDVSGIATSYYRLDGSTWIPYNTSFKLTTEGLHTIIARATDNMGYSTSETTFTFMVDSTAPTVTVTDSEDGKLKVDYGGKAYLEATDTGADSCTIYYSLTGGAPWTVYSTPLLIFNSTTITFYAVDALENTASIRSVDIVTTAPGTDDGMSLSWRILIGVGLILGGILVLVVTFLPERKPKKEEKARRGAARRNMDEGKGKKSKKDEEPEERPNRHKRNK